MSDAPEEKTDEPPRDTEGLLLHYDVILCGTGLVQSILSSALARAGKTVLHCDGAEHYGELDAVWNMQLIEGIFNDCHTEEGNEEVASEEGTDGSTILRFSRQGACQSLRIHTKEIHTTSDIDQHPEIHTCDQNDPVTSSAVEDSIDNAAVQREGENTPENKSQVLDAALEKEAPSTDTSHISKQLFEKQPFAKEVNRILVQQQRYLSLDASPALVLAAGRAVQGMLASGVAEYLEFKTIEGLYWLDDEMQKSIQKVPCSKGDVFNTKLLKPLDKRRLMKFLQLTMDYATSLSEDDENTNETANETDETSAETGVDQVQSLNERRLNQGRSLSRPQNKAVATDELIGLRSAISAESVDFDGYLKQQKLSPHLCSLIRYALAWETRESSTSIAKGMKSLCHHLQSLGRYGSTAFLTPMYGSGELSQAFCRSAAVFGASYLLRRAPLAVRRDAAASTNRLHVLLGGDRYEDAYRPRGSDEDKWISCDHVVASRDACLGKKPAEERRVVRRISIVLGKVLPSVDDEQRHVVAIPPGTVGNKAVIQCILVDDSAQVAPSGCTIIHLTTTSIGEDSTSDTDLLDRAVSSILESPDTNKTVEVFKVVFSFSSSTDNDGLTNVSSHPGLHLCHHVGQEITADASFEQAERIFRQICPGVEFLGLSEEMDTLVKERVTRNEEDDERVMLDSAVDMIAKEHEEPGPSETPTPSSPSD